MGPRQARQVVADGFRKVACGLALVASRPGEPGLEENAASPETCLQYVQDLEIRDPQKDLYHGLSSFYRIRELAIKYAENGSAFALVF